MIPFLSNDIFLELFQVHHKLSRKYRQFLYTSYPPKRTAFPLPVSHSRLEHLLELMNLPSYIIITPSPCLQYCSPLVLYLLVV